MIRVGDQGRWLWVRSKSAIDMGNCQRCVQTGKLALQGHPGKGGERDRRQPARARAISSFAEQRGQTRADKKIRAWTSAGRQKSWPLCSKTEPFVPLCPSAAAAPSPYRYWTRRDEHGDARHFDTRKEGLNHNNISQHSEPPLFRVAWSSLGNDESNDIAEQGGLVSRRVAHLHHALSPRPHDPNNPPKVLLPLPQTRRQRLCKTDKHTLLCLLRRRAGPNPYATHL